MNTCFFIGHREASESLLPVLQDTVARHITEYGVTAFYVGHYGGFDRLAARAVREAKQQHPEVTLTMVLPYHPAERPMDTPKGFDGTFYPPLEKVPRRLAIVRANRYMVDTSTHLISHVWHPASNSYELLEYARSRERRGLIQIENLTDH